ncbi:MAG: class I SAM-dependent methyltransferase [Planctomycetota bacterium]
MSRTIDHVVCVACNRETYEPLLRIDNATVFSNVLWDDRQAALAAPRAPMSLGFCRSCGMIYNVAFNPALMRYGPRYENALEHSPRFRRYARALADRLVRTYDLRGKHVVEIGCGQGRFLALLARLGNNHAVGYDPSYDPSRAGDDVRSLVSIRNDYFTAGQIDHPVDFIYGRHVLEHLADPLPFLREVRVALAGDPTAAVYFEVPNALSMVRDLSIWDLLYEHCSYFTAESLVHLFCRAGFTPVDVAEPYDGQFLSIEARPRAAPSDCLEPRWRNPARLAEWARDFEKAYTSIIAGWGRRLEAMTANGRRPVVWGAGAKGVTFLNVLQAAWERLPYVVDLNPDKHGHYVTGTGQEIVPPAALSVYRPDHVIVMNPLYEEEITRTLRQMGLTPAVALA